MVEQTSSLLERLKACWHIVTKDNYAVFCINNNHIVWNEDGTYNRIKSNSMACYCKATYDVKLKVNYSHLKEGACHKAVRLLTIG